MSQPMTMSGAPTTSYAGSYAAPTTYGGTIGGGMIGGSMIGGYGGIY
jgi:hypothetical protein